MLDSELIAGGRSERGATFSSGTMKHTFLVVMMFAAAPLLAQGSAKARTELANAIAVEEQERDLAKAEQAYRAAIDDTKLSAEARKLAKERLGLLLKKLGRDAEAKQFLDDGDKGTVATLDDVTEGVQDDVERQKALREKARELVQKILAQSDARYPPPPRHGVFDGQLREQLLWIGEAAVPEIAGALAAEQPAFADGAAKPVEYARKQAVAGLAGLLWYFGGETSLSHLEALWRSGGLAFRRQLVQNAYEMRDDRMKRLAERWLTEEPRGDVAMTLLAGGSHPNLVVHRLDPEAVLDSVGKLDTNARAWTLEVFANRPQRSLPRPVLTKLHTLARTFLDGADPEAGRAAQRFIARRASRASPEGVFLLLEYWPRLPDDVAIESSELPKEWLAEPPRDGRTPRLRREAAAELWPRLVACASARPTGAQWISDLLSRCAQELDAAIVPDVIRLISAGVDDLVWALRGKVNLGNAVAVFATYDGLDANAAKQLLVVLGDTDLPPELFEPLRERADAAPEVERLAFFGPIGRTGNPDAATWLVDHLTKESVGQVGGGLWRLVRRTQDERVRAAIHEAVVFADMTPSGRAAWLLALLAMRDRDALRLVVEYGRKVDRGSNPLAPDDAGALLPIEYLIYENPNPPHGFTDEEIVQVVRDLANAGDLFQLLPLSGQWSFDTIRPGVFGEFARLACERFRDQEGWTKSALARVRNDAKAGPGPLSDWIARMLRHDEPRVRNAILKEMEAGDVATTRQAVEACLDDAVAMVAVPAARVLLRAGAVTPERLARSPHENVREIVLAAVADDDVALDDTLLVSMLGDKSAGVRWHAAAAAGAMLSTKAVPALVALLRDPQENVRQAATGALTRIRFHHEQESYWDRITKGLDASPTSAAEKLLLQAKPGATKEQRLLAIQSLGTLGVPEALPFLIEWTQDADAAIAKTAKDAITQIHLHPRK